jgi:two-component system, LytTR family, response regulator
VKPVRCLIVDDERLARASLRALIEALPGVEVAGEADRPKSAIAAVKELRPDVLLLDVQMPGGGGFAVLQALENPPPTIFVTAFDQYAVRAFEVNAVDYLLKPVEPERLAQALERAMRRRVEGEAVAGQPLGADDPAWLEIGASGHFRQLADLLAIEADDKYTRILCADGQRYVVRQPMSAWERRLPGEAFVRIERGLIVNRAAIRSVQFRTHAASFALAPDGPVFEVGRSGACRLRKLMGC